MEDVEGALVQPRIVIQEVSPCVEHGRWPAKATVGQSVDIAATIFMDGHDQIASQFLWREANEELWHKHRLVPQGNDRWHGRFAPLQPGLHHFRVEAWFDQWGTYRNEIEKKHQAGVPLQLELREGKLILESVHRFALSRMAKESDSAAGENESGEMSHASALEIIDTAISSMGAPTGQAERQEALVAIMLNSELADAVDRLESRQFFTATADFSIDVERLEAGFCSWYELFPRSATDSPSRHGSFDDVIADLPRLHGMGFDVLYLPPIHPVGHTNRKGRNNTIAASPGEPGSPYAIGSEEGGHEAVHSQLGGIDGFRRLMSAVKEYNMELALDFAIQCSPDHPWLTQHPEWFSWRPDGSLRYAENPPKKYQDIVNVDFYAEGAMPSLWLAWRDIIRYWIDEGVRIFRVDNPHTKPLPFWQWLINDIRRAWPDVIFLSEAFTRPAMMYRLAKIGFNQSYTYFIWRNTRDELTEYLTELTRTEVKDYYRPNFFVNTPDINPYFLQTSGRAGFLIRGALATTLSGLWGMYSGFEICEARALPDKEEYADSEKYEIRVRDFNAPGNIVSEITRLNNIRRQNSALQSHLGITFFDSNNDQVLYFGKADSRGGNYILVAISLDPHFGQEAWLESPAVAVDRALGTEGRTSLKLTELMRDLEMTWAPDSQHWYFDPAELPFAIWRVHT